MLLICGDQHSVTSSKQQQLPSPAALPQLRCIMEENNISSIAQFNNNLECPSQLHDCLRGAPSPMMRLRFDCLILTEM